MPKNPEKIPLNDEEKRAEEERLKKEEEKPKEIGWEEKFKSRQELIKEVKEEVKTKKLEEERISEKEADLKEAGQELAKAYKPEEPEKAPEEKEAEKLMQEKKDELDKEFKTLSDTEKYFFITKFYRNKLGYEPKYRGLLGGKARIWDKEKGGYVIDEKTGKPVEFEAKFSPKGETPFRKFLEEEYKNKIIKKDLKTKVEESEAAEKEKEYQEWLKSVGARDAQKLAQAFEAYKAEGTEPSEKKEKKESEEIRNPKDIFMESLNKELSAMEKSGRLSPEQVKEKIKAATLIETGFSIDPEYDALVFSRAGIADEKEMIEIFNKKKGLEGKTEKAWKGINFERMKAEGVFERMKKMKIDKNSKDIIGIIKKYYSSETPLPLYAGSLLRKYDQLSFEQYKFEKAKGNPESLKKWITIFLTDIKNPESMKRLKEVKLKTKKREGEPAEKLEEVKPHKIEELLEVEIERMNRGEVLQSIPPELKQYLIENGFLADKIDEMIPKEALLEAKRIYKKEDIKQDIKQQEENPLDQGSEELFDSSYEEKSRKILIKNKRKTRREAKKE